MFFAASVSAPFGRESFLIRVPDNEGDVLRGKRAVVVEEYQHFSVVEEERGDERRKDLGAREVCAKPWKGVFRDR